MEITWLGHSCFRIKGKEATVVTDPCHPDTGYTSIKLQSDIVTVSHSHSGHGFVEGVGGEPKLIRGPGEYEVKGVFITGLASFHDSEQGNKKGRNTVYLFEMDGVILGHLGDLGHLPTVELVGELARAEVLMFPAGGISTFSVNAAIELIKQLSPKVIIPMHFKTPVCKRDLEPVEKFLKEFGVRDIVPAPKLTVSRSSLSATTQVVLLEYPQK